MFLGVLLNALRMNDTEMGAGLSGGDLREGSTFGMERVWSELGDGRMCGEGVGRGRPGVDVT